MNYIEGYLFIKFFVNIIFILLNIYSFKLIRFTAIGVNALLTDFSNTFNKQFLLREVFKAKFSNYFKIYLFKFNTFFSEIPQQNVLNSIISIARQRIERNILWNNKNYQAVQNWLFDRDNNSFSIY